MSALFNRKSGVSFSPGLKTAALKIKKENQKIIIDQFEQYHMNLKAGYFFPLIEAATRDFKEKTKEQFKQYQFFKEEMDKLFYLKNDEKKEQRKKVQAIKYKIKSLSCDIASCSKISKSSIQSSFLIFFETQADN